MPRDLKRAVSLYERACDGGDSSSCMQAGVLLANGEALPRDVPRARALFEKACKAGQSLGCENASRLRR
jgi:TPR repeat protein